MSGRRFVALVAASAALAVLAAVPAPAAQDEYLYVSGPGGDVTTYIPPAFAIPAGSALRYMNLDAKAHDVIATNAFGSDDQFWCDQSPGGARDFPIGACPLFWSRTIGFGGTTPVLGIELIVPGEVYDFYCSLHPNMFGVLLALQPLET